MNSSALVHKASTALLLGTLALTAACRSDDPAPSPAPAPAPPTAPVQESAKAVPYSNVAPPSEWGPQHRAQNELPAIPTSEAKPAQPPATTPPKGGDSHQRMVALLAKIRDRVDTDNAIQGAGYTNTIRKRLKDLPAETPPAQQLLMRLMVSMFELRLGEQDRAIELLESGLELLPDDTSQVNQSARTSALLQLAVAYLRTGELENCCARETPDSCIFPIEGGGLHVKPRGSEGAIQHLTEVLERTKPPDTFHWQARWLLNIANMTLDRYPSGVPEAYRLPASVFTSEIPFPKFESVGATLGLNRASLGGGVVADDFDGDDVLDVMVSSRHPATPIALYKRGADGVYTDVASAAGLDGILGGVNMVQADYDNDGHLDVYVVRGAWLSLQGRLPNSLLKNRGDGRFTDVTFEAGLGEVHYPTQSASWADFDLDGDLDLYVANEIEVGSRGFPSQLFVNNGDGTFDDAAKSAGVTNDRYAKGAVWGDYDGDRYPDLYVSNFNNANRLYHNNGDGTFTDVAKSAGVDGPHASYPTWWWDYDNDGALDLYVSAYGAGIADLAAEAFGQTPKHSDTSRLYRGDGKGGFTDETAAVGLDRPMAPMAGNYGDLNNDGYPEFYVGTGYPAFEELMPNRLFLNQAGQRFRDVTMGARMGHLQKGHAVAIADFDSDGDNDVFQQMGGAYPADTFVNIFYRNPGLGGHHLTVELVGTTSNRSAIGARLKAKVIAGQQARWVHGRVTSGGSFGANPLRQTLGLGDADRVEELVIEWPLKGETQTLRDLPLDAAIRVTQGEPSFTRLALAGPPQEKAEEGQ